MSVFGKNLVQQIGESLGIQASNDVCAILSEDAEYRLRQVLNESVKFMRHSKESKLSHLHVNSALKVKNCQPLYGFSIDSEFKNHNQLYWIDDAEVDLEEMVNLPLPSVPLAPTFTAHWLAIEGVQP